MAKCFGELTLVKKISAEKDFTCISYIDNGNKIAAGNSDGLIRIYESSTLELLNTLGTPITNITDPAVPVTDISCIPPRNEKYKAYFVATYSNGYVKLWDSEKGKSAMTLDEQRQTYAIRFSQLVPNFLTVGDDAAIYLYDEKTMSVTQTFKSSDSLSKVDGHTSRVFCACFHPSNPNEFVTGGWDNTVQFWDTRKLNSIRYVTGPHICGNGIDFKPGTGKEFITAAYQKENPLQKWDYATGKLLVNLEGDMFRCMLYSGRWLNDDFLASGGTDPSLFRIMHVASNNTTGYFRSQQSGVHGMDCKVLKSVPHHLKKDHRKEEDFDIARCVICAGRFLLEIDANLVNK